MAKEFVISDESILNDRGFRVMTSGIRLDQFEKNPICLFMHSRPSRWDLKKDSILAIGTWEKLRVQDGKLIGTPVFDEGDDFAKKIMDKVEKGIYRMASPGLSPITTSSDERYLLPGQNYETLVESLLLEISIADFGSNYNALALYKKEDEEYVALSADESKTFVPLISIGAKTKLEENQTNLNMKNIAIVLGMTENATEEQIIGSVKRIQANVLELTSKVETIELSAIESAVQLGIDEKRFTADKKSDLIELGKKVGVESLKKAIELMRPGGKPTDHINGKGESLDSAITLSSLMQKGVAALELFKKDNPDEYAELYQAHYGLKYVAPVED